MPKYVPDREKGEAPGAGSGAGQGLSRARGSKALGKGLPEGVMPTRRTYGPDRKGFQKAVQGLKMEKRRQEAKKAHAEKGKPRPQVIDPKEYLKRITPQAMADFDEIFGQPAQPLSSLPMDVRYALSKFLGHEDKDHLIMREAYSPEIRRSRASNFAASLHVAKMRLEKKEWYQAFEILKELVKDYLIDRKAEIPRDKGSEAIRLMNIIAKAWMAAHASEYAGLDLERFGCFKRSGFLGRIVGSGLAVMEMEKAGDIQFLPLLRIIGYGCGEGAMEGYCARTASRIRLNEGLRLAFIGSDEEGLVPARRLSRDQLVYRLSFLFDSLGLGEFLDGLPQFAQFGSSGFSPVQNMLNARSLDELFSKGLDREFELDPPYHGTGIDGFGYATAKAFVLENGLAKTAGGEEGNCYAKLQLTEKGKALVAALLERISKVKIRYKGERESAMQSFMTEFFGF